MLILLKYRFMQEEQKDSSAFPLVWAFYFFITDELLAAPEK